MGNKATTIDEQIEILKKRGMNFDNDIKKSKEILQDIGYYRLGFYWHPFEIDKAHNFKENTNFSTIINLYYLDFDLRNLITNYINRIEINFRSNVIYYVSNRFKNSPTWFFDPNVVEQYFIKELPTFYDKNFIKNNKTIKNHHKKYINDKYAPAWKTLEFFSFGTILKIYSALKDTAIKQRISEKYNIRNIEKFENLMRTIVYLRNICAHSNVLFDLQTPKGISVVPMIDLQNDRHSLCSSLKVIDYILSKISINRSNDFKKDLNSFLSKYNDDEIMQNIIKEKMGFKNNLI